MTPETKEPDVLEDLVSALPPHLRENFEEAERHLQEVYQISPGIAVLVRMWIAAGEPPQIAGLIERSVMDIKRRGLSPNREGYFDEDDF
jgi:hypothetical protein